MTENIKWVLVRLDGRIFGADEPMFFPTKEEAEEIKEKLFGDFGDDVTARAVKVHEPRKENEDDNT